jgi:hypothetical protein
MTAPDLKAKNSRWLWAVIILDVAILVPIIVTSGTVDGMSIATLMARGVAAAAAPVIVLLLTSLLSADAKAALVFWRFKDGLPGHRAFSVYVHRDSRINLKVLRQKIGEFPISPREQNAIWYGLSQLVAEDASVLQAHRNYLLFRDLSALSFILGIAAPIVVLLTRGTLATALTVFGVLFAQYVLAAIAGRHNGIRFVTNVLALHGVSPVKNT